MTIDREEVERLAELAKLELDEDEIEQFRDDLGEVLEYVEKLDELDTEGVEPTTHAVPAEMRGRDDGVREGLSREEVLREAPDREGGEFRVPKVVD